MSVLSRRFSRFSAAIVAMASAVLLAISQSHSEWPQRVSHQIASMAVFGASLFRRQRRTVDAETPRAFASAWASCVPMSASSSDHDGIHLGNRFSMES